MQRLLALSALAATLAAAGCAPMSQDSYLVSGGPNPAPQPGYKVECTAQPLVPAYIFWPSYRSGCQQIVDPQAGAVIRARG